MENKDLKIGDRVRFLNAHDHKIYPEIYPAVGTIGKVIALDEYVGSARVIRVIWPEGSTSDNDICWCGVDDIEPVDNENEKANADYNAGYAEGLEADEKKAKAQAELDVCHDVEAVAKRNYERGLNDAWEAAKKLYLMPSEGGLSVDELDLIFGSQKYLDLTAADAVRKIQAFMENEKAEDKIKVGDGVTGENFRPFIVIREKDETLYGITEDGQWAMMPKDKAWKTGRHFPQIAEALKQMKGE